MGGVERSQKAGDEFHEVLRRAESDVSPSKFSTATTRMSTAGHWPRKTRGWGKVKDMRQLHIRHLSCHATCVQSIPPPIREASGQ